MRTCGKPRLPGGPKPAPARDKGATKRGRERISGIRSSGPTVRPMSRGRTCHAHAHRGAERRQKTYSGVRGSEGDSGNTNPVPHPGEKGRDSRGENPFCGAKIYAGGAKRAKSGGERAEIGEAASRDGGDRWPFLAFKIVRKRKPPSPPFPVPKIQGGDLARQGGAHRAARRVEGRAAPGRRGLGAAPVASGPGWLPPAASGRPRGAGCEGVTAAARPGRSPRWGIRRLRRLHCSGRLREERARPHRVRRARGRGA